MTLKRTRAPWLDAQQAIEWIRNGHLLSLMSNGDAEMVIINDHAVKAEVEMRYIAEVLDHPGLCQAKLQLPGCGSGEYVYLATRTDLDAYKVC